MKLPVKLISRARRTPIAWGRSTVRPQPGITPTRVWVSPNLACSLAIRKSQLSASSNPPVTATPLIAPISGLVRRGKGPRAPLRAGAFSDPPPEPELIPVEPSSFRSSPAQNAGSAPVSTITLTSSSASAAAHQLRQQPQHLARQRVAHLGPVERHRRDPVGDVEQHRRFASSRSFCLDVVGGQEREPEVAELHERRRDPPAERPEVVVEDRARPVGERLLDELVETLVGDLDGVLGGRRGRPSRWDRGDRSRP